MRAHYQFSPGLCLEVDGDPATVRHFDREYGAAGANVTTPAAVEVHFAGHTTREPEAPTPGGWVAGGHKSMRWWTRLSEPNAAVLGARIDVSGWPRGFARTLVQGYFVEPLLSVAAARLDLVLLPAAAFVDMGGAVAILGQSGSGKTSLAMHGLALGVRVLGDDQVIVAPDGSCGPFPRRLRLYSDLHDRAPLAYGRLPRRVAAQLAMRRLVRLLSRGAIAPALAVPASVFGARTPGDLAPIRHLVMLERATVPGDIRTEPATTDDAIARALQLLREQRQHLVLAAGDKWLGAIRNVEAREARLLAAAFASASVERIVVPSPLTGGAMARLGEAVGMKQPAPPEATPY